MLSKITDEAVYSGDVVAMPVHSAQSQTAINVSHVGKVYRIYDQPVDRLKYMLFWRFGRSYGREFWALRDVSFEVKKGSSLGIIGRNGSGKSTLLQMIARTLTPSEGTIEVNGRVAALLELGSGFNPEFTGRENVFLNGAILGLSRDDMEARFEEIADFADIGDFIEQPVKLYSSGMSLRLAFAVQAIIPKEILIVDEALAVGDEAFQRKCMRKLEEFRANGGTVLLVTHSTDTIVRHCDQCVWLHQGRTVLGGNSKPITDIYQRFGLSSPQKQLQILDSLRQHADQSVSDLISIVSETGTAEEKSLIIDKPSVADDMPVLKELVYGTGQADIIDPGMFSMNGKEINILTTGQICKWQFRVYLHDIAWNLNFGMMIRSIDGQMIIGTNTEWEGLVFSDKYQAGTEWDVRFILHLNIVPGIYFLEAGVIGDTATTSGPGNFLQRRVDICAIRVVPPGINQIHGIAYADPTVEVEMHTGTTSQVFRERTHQYTREIP